MGGYIIFGALGLIIVFFAVVLPRKSYSWRECRDILSGAESAQKKRISELEDQINSLQGHIEWKEINSAFDRDLKNSLHDRNYHKWDRDSDIIRLDKSVKKNSEKILSLDKEVSRLSARLIEVSKKADLRQVKELTFQYEKVFVPKALAHYSEDVGDYLNKIGPEKFGVLLRNFRKGKATFQREKYQKYVDELILAYRREKINQSYPPDSFLEP